MEKCAYTYIALAQHMLGWYLHYRPAKAKVDFYSLKMSTLAITGLYCPFTKGCYSLEGVTVSYFDKHL